ncbi:MAG: preprotein translocase subunit SecY [Thermoprotei archaeon]
MGFVDVLSALGRYLPTVSKPKERVPLPRKLLWSLVAVVMYLIMTSVPLYGANSSALFNFLLQQVIFASSAGTLAQLGIGPIITAGLIMQILAGSKLIQVDLKTDEGKAKFTEAQRGLAFIFILLESLLFAIALTRNNLSLQLALAVFLQLVVATYVIMLLDEMIQNGWGLGSGLSLFILAGVMKMVFWDMFGVYSISNQNLAIGFFPSLYSVLITGGNVADLIVNTSKPFQPDLVGLIATIALIVVTLWLSSINVNIPITSQKFRGVKSSVPLNLLYVSSIPVIFVSVLGADLQLFVSLASTISPASNVALQVIETLFLFPPGNYPHSVYAVVLDPIGALAYAVVFILLSVAFGILWVGVSGLDPATQARNMIEAGLEIPGMRSNPKVLESILAKYIYPLTIFSSFIVGLIAVVATLLGAYGSGVGILLSTTIAMQYYKLITYERTLDMYPLLRRLVGE